jgi:polyribonucleotide nucleotidyltransferase
MDIAAEVVGWVIGKNGATIKDLKMKTGCNMWVDQRALKLTITGPDARIVEHAAKSVEAYIAAAPIKAGAVDAAVARSIDCPEHLLEILADRNTITKIVKETQAQVVVNRKMSRAIVCGTPHAVSIACSRVHSILAQAAAEYENEHGPPPGASLSGSPPAVRELAVLWAQLLSLRGQQKGRPGRCSVALAQATQRAASVTQH